MPSYKETESRIRNLPNKWDPIGVKGEGKTQDEYDSYIARIYKMLLDNRSENEINDTLIFIAESEIGVNADKEKTRNVSRMLKNISVS